MAEEKQCPCVAMIQVQEDVRNHDKRLAQGDTNFKVLDLQLTTISKNTDEIKQDVKRINEKPAKKWDGFTDKLLNIVMTVVLVWVLAQIGIK